MSRIRVRSRLEPRNSTRDSKTGCSPWRGRSRRRRCISRVCSERSSRAWALTARVYSAKHSRAWNLPLAVLRACSLWIATTLSIWNILRENWHVETLPDFLKRICNKHDGEARLLRRKWVPMALPVDVCNPAFWSAQFATTQEASRQRLAGRSARARLSSLDVDWLFNVGNNQTTVVLFRSVAASGAARYNIVAGNAVALAQMYFRGEELRTACDIYKLYMDFPILVHKVRHGEKRSHHHKVSHGEKRNQRRRGEPRGDW